MRLNFFSWIQAKRPSVYALVRSYSALFLLRVVEKILNFVSFTVLIRNLSVETMATYNFIQSVVAAIAIFALPEMKNSVAQSVARGFKGTYRLVVLRAGAISLLGAVFVALAAFYLFKQGETETGTALAVVAVFFPVVSGLAHWRGYLHGRGEFTRFAFIEGITALLRALALMAAVVYGFTTSAVVLAIVSFSFPALLNLSMTLHFRALTRALSEAEPGSLKYGTVSSLYAGVAQFSQHVEKLVLFSVAPHSMAIYVAGERWSATLQGLVQDLAVVMLPNFARRPCFDRQLDRTLQLLSIGLGAISMVVALFMFPVLIPWAFGETYADSIWVAQLLTAASILVFHSSFRFRYVKSKQDLKNYRNVTLLGPAIRILLAVPLVYAFDLIGAIASVFIGNIIINRMIHRAIQDHKGN